MKQEKAYTSPTAEVIEIASEDIFCASPVFGNDGNPGNDYYDMDDIFDGGSF